MVVEVAVFGRKNCVFHVLGDVIQRHIGAVLSVVGGKLGFTVIRVDNRRLRTWAVAEGRGQTLKPVHRCINRCTQCRCRGHHNQRRNKTGNDAQRNKLNKVAGATAPLSHIL